MNEEVLHITCHWRDANENRSAGACGFGQDRNPHDSKLVRTQSAPAGGCVAHWLAVCYKVNVYLM